MLKIHSLLNPSALQDNSRLREASVSPPPTPAYTQASSTISTPRLQTPSTASPTKRPKLVKDAAIFVRGTPKQPVNYVPFECTEDALYFSAEQQQELAKQHERFEVFPNGRGDAGFIADYQRHIPYSSDKKAFFGKTNRDAFEGTYAARPSPCPRSSSDRSHSLPIHFPYAGCSGAAAAICCHVGLPGRSRPHHAFLQGTQVLQGMLPSSTTLRRSLTSFQTTPAKALTANPGLKELSHSITGGALAAQGYWMPYACARAVCLTFCYPIRWALTPIFGPSFIKDCLKPEHPGFCRFKIGSDVIRFAQQDAEDMRSGPSTRKGSPIVHGDGHIVGTQDIPRSVPPSGTPLKQLRPRKEPPRFKLGSPFDFDTDCPDNHYTHGDLAFESPELSPKTTRHVASPGWTSINQQPCAMPPSPPNNTPVGSLSGSLLTKPRTLPTTSWRALDATTTMTRAPKVSTGDLGKYRARKSRICNNASAEAEYVRSASSSSSESDDVDILVSPIIKKRQRREDTPAPQSSPSHFQSGKSTKYTATDARAAQWLLNLSVRDSQLASGQGQMRGQKRRASMV